MSRENEAERKDSEGIGRGQCLPCLFSKFEVAGDLFIMRKNNWMMSLFSFSPVRRSGQPVFGYRCISMHLISQFSEIRSACALTVFYRVLCARF